MTLKIIIKFVMILKVTPTSLVGHAQWEHACGWHLELITAPLSYIFGLIDTAILT